MKIKAIYKVILIFSIILMLFCTIQIPEAKANIFEDINNWGHEKFEQIKDFFTGGDDEQEAEPGGIGGIVEDTPKATLTGGGIIDPDKLKPTNPSAGDIQPALDVGNIIIGAIRVIGVVVLVVTLMIIGIKYMTGSVSEKAEYKKTMIPYLIGAFVFLALTQLIAVIIDFASVIQ